MSKDSAIVVYIPNKGNYLEQFYGLYYSVVFKTSLYEKFDFLVCGPKEIAHLLPDEHCVFVELNEISKLTIFRHAYSNHPYGFTDSFAPFVDGKCIEVLLNYKYCIRLDTDTFLCENITSIRCDEDSIFTGVASYSSETARQKLPQIMNLLGLPDQGVHNIGSTWLGTTENMIRQAARTLDFTSHFLRKEFVKDEGKWPQWFAGVILLYAGHVAINSSGLRIIKTNKFDFQSSSKEEVSEQYTLHCWHTDNFFSKFAFSAGKYNERKTDPDSLRCDEYSFHCAMSGRQMLQDTVQKIHDKVVVAV